MGQILETLVAGNEVEASNLNNNFTKVDNKFGGDGSDGALSVASGTTTVDLGSAKYVVKNYTSINIASGATLTFSNPHSEGTIIVLKSQGDVTIEGSIDGVGFGAAGGAGSVGNTSGLGAGAGSNGNNAWFVFDSNIHYGLGGDTLDGGDGGVALTNTIFYLKEENKKFTKTLYIKCGDGGGGGQGGSNASGAGAGGTGGTGGAGGAGLIVECGGELDFSGTIDVSGADGENGGNQTGTYASAGGGGGGGSAGMCVLLYNSVSINTGTITASGGDGGDGGSATGTDGGSTTCLSGSGGGGAGSYTAVGGAGGTGRDVTGNGNAGNNAGGAGAGAGGGGGGNTESLASTFTGGAGGTGGTTEGGLSIENTEF